jgi:hypothetical protein
VPDPSAASAPRGKYGWLAGAAALAFATALFLYGAALVAAYALARPSVLFAPSTPLTMADAGGVPPSASLMAMHADDGTRLLGLRLDARSDRPWVLFFYGNAESTLIEAPRLQWLRNHYGVNVACFDYRGYGFSDGLADPVLIRNDAVREFDWVRMQARTAPVIVYGYSLGSQLAIHVAASRPVAGVIVEAAPSSAPDMVAWMLRYPAIRTLRWLSAPLLPLRPDPSVVDFLSAEREVRGLRVPLVVVHGTRDLVIPFGAGAQRLRRGDDDAEALHRRRQRRASRSRLHAAADRRRHQLAHWRIDGDITRSAGSPVAADVAFRRREAVTISAAQTSTSSGKAA